MLIIVVDDIRNFHKANFSENPQHYSFLMKAFRFIPNKISDCSPNIFYNNSVYLEVSNQTECNNNGNIYPKRTWVLPLRPF